MFYEICIYEVKLNKEEEVEELMKEVRAFYKEQPGVIDVKYIKRTYRQKDFNAVKAGEVPIPLTRYVDEYSEELYNLILKNNIEAKNLKQKIRDITKKLKELNYLETELDDKVKLNIDFAKRHLVDSVYKQAILEGIATTFADTESIIEGGKVNNMTSEDVLKVINLKHAWEFILNKNVIVSNSNFSLLCEINKLIEQGFYYNAGKVRSTPVSITGTNWIPALPIESMIKEELEDIYNSSLSMSDKAIELLLYTTKKQIFIDGNKRTAVIFANHFLISKGKGIIVVPAELVDEYKKLLVSYYEGKDSKEIKVFLKEKCFMKIG